MHNDGDVHLSFFLTKKPKFFIYTPENMEALRKLILDDIIEVIRKNQECGNITAADARRLHDLIHKLYNHLYSHYTEFIEGGMNDMMEDGLILETDIIEAELTKKLTKQITDEVTDKVTKQVTEQSQRHFILKAYEKLCDIEQVAAFLDLSPDIVRKAVQGS